MIGKKILVADEIDSTNDEARRLAGAKGSEGTVVIAYSQTKGRGRLGRRWVSPRGGIYLSIILRPYINTSRLPVITLMTAVACARTLRGLTGLDVSVKWPNDIIISSKKVGGILCETAGTAVIVGIGLNLNADLGIFPASLKKQVTSVKFESGVNIGRDKVIKILLEEFDGLYGQFLHRKDKDILNEWSSLCRMLGSKVEIETARRKLEGYAESVGGRGELILRTYDGKIRKVYSADAVKVQMEK